MIEIIREEGWESAEKKALPKDIKQIGRPDIGDRIYVENQVYQFLHPCGSREEKAAYVLLGRFENYAGKQCTFIEAAIRLAEIKFDAELPIWNDDTWAYIYRQLKREYESMVIAGWALDKRGQLPQMTERLEALHQNYFGGERQILLLMDTLEREEVFYGNKDGHFGRRDGFYIYYDKKAAAGMKRVARAFAEADEPESPTEDAADWKKEAFFTAEPTEDAGGMHRQTEEPDHGRTKGSRTESPGQGDGTAGAGEAREQEEETGRRTEKSEYEDSVVLRTAERRSGSETEQADGRGRTEGINEKVQNGGDFRSDAWEREKWEDVRRREEARRKADRARDGWGVHAAKRKNGTIHAFFNASTRGGHYQRENVKYRQEKEALSYAPSVLLMAVVCALGVTAYLNHQKMNEMEETIARMNSGKTTNTVQSTETIKIEEVAGNVRKQETKDVDAAAGPSSADVASQAGGSEKTGSQEAAADIKTQPGADASGADKASPGAEPDKETTQPGTDVGGDVPAPGAETTEQETQAPEEEDTDKTTETAAMTEAQTYLKQGYYIVQKGDSLVGICRKVYQTTAMMDKLCEANGIDDPNAIYAGQYLTLPQ